MTQPDQARHPESDLLADLAAAVLPADQIPGVEQHLLGCPHCTGLLAEAEGVRLLLLADPVDPMPIDIAARLDASLRKASRWAQAHTAEGPAIGGVGALVPVTGSVPATGSVPTTGSLPQESFFSEPFPTAAIPVGSIPVGAPASGSRLRRPGRGPQRTRRQVREEERDSRPIWARPVFAVAAGLVAVAGIGIAVQQATGSSQSASTAAGSAQRDVSQSAAAAEAPAAVAILATGTDYSAKKLAAQTAALVRQARSSQALAADNAGRPAAAGGTGGASPEASAAPTAKVPSAAQPGQTLRDPVALEACLSAIDSAGVRPIAVDLARYQGREAAILVLPAPAGGFEVWAVARDCKPGADGTLNFQLVK